VTYSPTIVSIPPFSKRISSHVPDTVYFPPTSDARGCAWRFPSRIWPPSRTPRFRAIRSARLDGFLRLEVAGYAEPVRLSAANSPARSEGAQGDSAKIGARVGAVHEKSVARTAPSCRQVRKEPTLDDGEQSVPFFSLLFCALSPQNRTR